MILCYFLASILGPFVGFFMVLLALFAKSIFIAFSLLSFLLFFLVLLDFESNCLLDGLRDHLFLYLLHFLHFLTSEILKFLGHVILSVLHI